jgi:hypothetical protein
MDYNKYFEEVWEHQQGALFLKQSDIYALRKNLCEFFFRKGFEACQKSLEETTLKSQENFGIDEGISSRELYLQNKTGEIIGIHAVGYEGLYQYTLEDTDGKQIKKDADFQILDIWGNKYDKDYNMIGGSFRVFYIDWDEMKKDMLEDGEWTEIKRGP